jgi:hypothetical protein
VTKTIFSQTLVTRSHLDRARWLQRCLRGIWPLKPKVCVGSHSELASKEGGGRLGQRVVSGACMSGAPGDQQRQASTSNRINSKFVYNHATDYAALKYLSYLSGQFVHFAYEYLRDSLGLPRPGIRAGRSQRYPWCIGQMSSARGRTSTHN